MTNAPVIDNGRLINPRTLEGVTEVIHDGVVARVVQVGHPAFGGGVVGVQCGRGPIMWVHVADLRVP